MTTTSLSSNPFLIGGLAVIVASGFILAKDAPTYGTGLLTVHKLVAVGIIVFLAQRARHAHAASGLSGLAWVTLIATAVAFLTMIGTGGALSAMDNPPSLVGSVHRVVPWVAIGCTTLALYLVPANAR